MNETISVTAQSSELQTDRSEVRAEIGMTSLQNLTVPAGRNYQQLFRVIPGFPSPFERALGALQPGAIADVQRERRGYA